MYENVTSSRIKARRVELGLSQSDVASKMNVDRTTVAKWETGANNMKQGTLKALSVVLDCSPVWLAGLEGISYTTEFVEERMKDMKVKQLKRLQKYIDYLLEARGDEDDT